MINIRCANISDKQDYSKLVMLSAEKYFRFLFSDNIPIILQKLFVNNNSFFSYKLCDIAEYNKNIAGCLVSFSYRDKKIYDTKTALSMAINMKFNFIIYMKRILKCTSIIGEFKENEFYVSNLATYPEYQNKGIATALLEKAYEKASSIRSEKIVLDVETEKESAIKLYKKLGYDIENKINLIFKNVSYNFYRMSKYI
jgi:ribosomal protein S18 acetylase RimI-like enzyme